jgi:predicted alpha/beta-fold hydrolase
MMQTAVQSLIWWYHMCVVFVQTVWLHMRIPTNSLIKTSVENTYAHAWKSSEEPNKHVIFLLSGLYSLAYHGYMRKTVDDLLSVRSIADKYQLIVYENTRKSSLEMQAELADYIHAIHRAAGGLDELILLGFSAGGILASHVMHELSNISATKKIITYDTPLHMIDAMRSLNRTMMTKLALIYFHYEMTILYRNHANYDRIKPYIFYRFKGLDDSLKMVETIHELSRDQLNHYCIRFS